MASRISAAAADGANTLAADLDFAQLLDLAENALSGTGDGLGSGLGASDAAHSLVRSQVVDDALASGFMGEWDLQGPSIESQFDLEEPDYARFEDWIPHLIRPERPCSECRSSGLNCYILPTEKTCTPCKSLFRECSLVREDSLDRARNLNRPIVDTLDVVDEDASRDQVSPTDDRFKRDGLLKSKTQSSSADRIRADDAPGSTKRHGIRFPRHAVKSLRDWLDSHANNPYPNEDEKAELEKKTDLKPSQIANWLANARRRRKVTETRRPPLCASPSLRPETPAIPIPGVVERSWDELDPLERWRNSPPEHEPASISDIAQAVANTELPHDDSSPSNSSQRRRSDNGSPFSNTRALSSSSFDTGQTSSASASTVASARSHGSFGSFRSSLAGKKERRRRRRAGPHIVQKSDGDKKRIFQCTFCTDTFKSKYDWTRHEKSLHLSLEKWICAPLGPVTTDPATGNKKCVYCDVQDPTDDHVESHNHRQCEDKGLDSRTFYRKDHLRQHLRLMHNCEMTSSMETWRSVVVDINSRCGFCAKRFTVWQARVDHLTAHFKAGAHMRDWKGCRGLDPAVAAQVMNAMPPYLIGIESVSPIPFSASNRATWRTKPLSETDEESNHSTKPVSNHLPSTSWNDDCSNDPSSKATTWEVLTVRLGKFANQMARNGVTLTDEMLQSQSRVILYGTDDNWNQTAADNPEWLDLFKKAHGLDFIPSTIGGQGAVVPEDLETYGDLGLRVPFAVQLKAYNEIQAAEKARVIKGAEQKAELERLRSIYLRLSQSGILCAPDKRCSHLECNRNQVNVLPFEKKTSHNPSTRHWCIHAVPVDSIQDLGALVTAQESASSSPRRTPDTSANDLSSTTFQSVSASLSPEASVDRAKPFVQRHKYRLPKDRFQRFATTTDAWQDSGLMPMPFNTADMMAAQNVTISTGAMMEFLGPKIGESLPFVNANTSVNIPLLHASDLNWNLPTNPVDEAAMLRELDTIIAETATAAQDPGTTSSPALPNAPTTILDYLVPTDLKMEDINFDDLDMNYDIDMNFDHVFDMSLDETFHQTS